MKCPDCSSEKLSKKGFRWVSTRDGSIVGAPLSPTPYRRKLQQYQCRECGKIFVLKEG